MGFSEQSWGPLVSVCSEETGKKGHDVVTQCAAVEQRITAQLSEVCSTSVHDPAPRTDPDAMPTKCSHQCASVLMPFYHDCASELMASSPELLARCTGRIHVYGPSVNYMYAGVVLAATTGSTSSSSWLPTSTSAAGPFLMCSHMYLS